MGHRRCSADLPWDAKGKLLQIDQVDSGSTVTAGSYVWSAQYDGLGRRIQTDYIPAGANAFTIAKNRIQCWFDPQVEFMAAAVEHHGKREWLVHGPDMDAFYGSFQGLGGLEALVDEATGKTTPIVDTVHGHVVATIDLGDDPANAADDVIRYKEQQFGGYGPLPGSQQQPLEVTEDLATSLGWQTRFPDPTSFFAMGARCYDPLSGRFLSADPFGHSATPDLYSYAGGDPINFVDPTGRFYEGYWGDVGGTLMNMPGTFGTAFGGAMDYGSGWMAAPFDSEVSGGFFQSSQDKSFSGQVYAAGGSHEDAVFAAGAIGTSAVAALGTATAVALGTEITIASGMTGTMTTTVAEQAGIYIIGGGVAGGIAAKGAMDATGAAATSAYVWSITAGAEATGTAISMGAYGLFGAGFYADQTATDTIDTGGFSGVDYGPLEKATFIYDAGGNASKAYNALMAKLDSYETPSSSNAATFSLTGLNNQNAIQDPTGKHIKP